MTNDTPTIEEAVAQASQTVVDSDTTEEATTEEVSTVEEAVKEEPQETPDKESQEETPLDKFDPDKLPPELQKVYKDMQKGFTQGRQKDREELNALQKELQELKKQVNPEPEWENLTPEQKIERYAEQKVTEAKLNDFREQAIKDYNSIDKRLDNSEGNESYDKMMDVAISTQLDKLLDDHVEQHGNELGFDYKSHAQELIKAWDSYKQQAIDRYLEKQRSLAKKSEARVNKASPKGTASTDSVPSGSMTLEQAMQAAASKIGK